MKLTKRMLNSNYWRQNRVAYSSRKKSERKNWVTRETNGKLLLTRETIQLPIRVAENFYIILKVLCN